ncbi:MAG TPA: RNA methyltransferase [Halomicronema sp.]
MLTSRQNPLVKLIRKVHKPKGRQETNLFLLEGTHLLEEACAVEYSLETVCATPEWIENHPQLWDTATKQASRCEIVNDFVLQALATTIQPDGVVATAKRKTQNLEESTISSLIVALETIQDPGNLGTIIRTAAGAGAGGVWLSDDSADPEQPKVLRASAGAWFRLPVARKPDLTASVSRCRDNGVQVIATTAAAQKTYWEIDYQKPTIILLGNEGAGLSASLLKLASHQVQIPLNNGVESLNVAMAAAVILYEAQRQQQKRD